jgi:MFS family permease
MTTMTRTAVDRRRWLVLALLATAQLMLVLDVTVVNVALPDIGAGLGLGRAVIPWVMTAYTLVFGGLMLLGGRIADLVGPRRIVLLGLTVFIAASLGCGLAGDPAVLLAGRAARASARRCCRRPHWRWCWPRSPVRTGPGRSASGAP